jgi:hypothetical protein
VDDVTELAVEFELLTLEDGVSYLYWFRGVDVLELVTGFGDVNDADLVLDVGA